MTRIKFEVAVDYSGLRDNTVSLTELRYTNQEWSKMSRIEKKVAIQDFVDDMPDQPYLVVERWEEQ